MQYENFGSTGLKVSRLFFGGAHLGEIIFQEKAKELVHAAWDVGINTFYTADDYNHGDAERIIGELIKPRRDDVVLIVKTGYRVGTELAPVGRVEYAGTGAQSAIDHFRLWGKGIPPTSRGLSRKHLTDALEASLKRLQTDYIDVYSAHIWDYQTPIEETISTLQDFIHQGKVRYISCSQTKPWQLYSALWASDRLGAARYQAVQIRCNLLERSTLVDYQPAAKAAGVSLLAFSSLAGDLLTGAFSRDSARPPGRGYRQLYMDMYWNPTTFDFLEELGNLAKTMGRPMGELAQAWTLAQRPVLALQIGPNEPCEFKPQASAVDNPLADDELAAVDNLLSGKQLDFVEG